jgi:serine phosphatase RsbU (regulator of sigma subunit)
MFAAPDWPEAPLELPAGWSILLFTDGVIEGGVGGGPDRLGEDGLQRLIADYVGRRPGWRGDPTSYSVS